ncbi:MAG: CapA family protein [Balneolaceae bacterium]|nr:CapA family protein [Balneolaceae bacterium]
MPKLFLTGDILPADRQHTLGIGTGSKFRQTGGEHWYTFFEQFDKNDSILFGNLEAPLVSSTIKNQCNKDFFAGDETFSKWLSRAGFDVVSVANNHILEFGEAGFHHTVQALQNDGIETVGIFDDLHGSNLSIIKKENCTFGFAAFNAVHDIQNDDCYASLSEKAVKHAIDGLRKREVDLICLSFHWGNEYIHIPSWEQVQLARKAIDWGADLIIGHHPHVVQPVEQYKQGWILYSLGNFIFDMNWSRNV